MEFQDRRPNILRGAKALVGEILTLWLATQLSNLRYLYTDWFLFAPIFLNKDKKIGVYLIRVLNIHITLLLCSLARIEWVDICLAYLSSTPIAAIFQAERLWYYDYYISFSFFFFVPSLRFHLKVHWHGLSEGVISRLLKAPLERLSRTLHLFPFPITAVTQCSPNKYRESIKNFQIQITCWRSGLVAHCVAPPCFVGW